MATPSESKLRVEIDELHAENDELRLRLEEAEQALEAIRTGQVESLVVEGPNGPRIFSLEGATQSYRVLVEAMNEGAVTLAENGNVLYCNARFAAMVRQPLQRVMGSSVRDLIAEGSRAAFDELLERARDSAAREEMTLRTSDGQEIPAYLSVSSIVDDGRRVLCLIATDLREQKRTEAIVAAEQAARESAERLAVTLRSIGDAVIATDEAGRVTILNRVAEDLTGWGAEEALGRPLHDVFHIVNEDTRQRVESPVPRVLREGVVVGLANHTALIAKDGTERPIADSGAPIRDSSGRISGVVLVFRDQTEERQAQHALVQSAREVREADRRKDEFLGMLSHELRNPLAPIRTATFILQHAAPGSDQARRAQSIIERQTEHLTRLVDDLLDVTRIARGKIELRKSRVELRDVIARAADDYRGMLLDRGVRLDVVLPDEKLWADADATRIAQIVGNLLHNAAKFTGRGGQVSVAGESDGRDAILRVRDTGVGIDPKLLPTIFDAFVQGERTLARTDGGLGLGLALVKGIAELHGGSVRAESAGNGSGAEFVVRLPLALAPDATSRGTPASEQRSSGRRVLVVDDNRDAAETLADLVTLLGHVAELAYDGPSAIEKARANPPNVVLCDIGLPGMSGYEVATALRASALEGVQLIAVSGYAQPEDVKRAIDAGFDGHVAKPFDIPKIERLLG